MKKQTTTFLALTSLCGAIYGAVAANTTAPTKPELLPVKSAKKTVTKAVMKWRSPSGLNAPLPPLSTLELKSIPPHAIPMQFNGGTVYWIPLNEKAPVKEKTRAHKAS